MREPGEATATVAVVSLHTSPLDQPGTGDSGGMNVYIRAVAERLACRGVAVDVFTRCRGRGVPEVEEVGELTRVIQVQAGPCEHVPKEELPDLLPQFATSILHRRDLEGRRYDLVHSHYWLSGWAGRVAKRRWGVPLVASFHTLGKVKNLALADEDDSEPPVRVDGEFVVIREADRILAPTPAEAAHLVELYRAGPEQIRVVPPGVDTALFRPRSREGARAALGLAGRRVVLFVGRLQRLKGPDVAIRAVAEAVRRDPAGTRDLALVLVGGPSGNGHGPADRHRLERLAGEVGIRDRVVVLEPFPHDRLPEVFAGADLVLVPSRSESFGLVALEAQACGVPVIAADVGGLRFVVEHGRTGYLVAGHDPVAYADRLLAVLADPALATRLSAAAVRRAAGFSWDETAERILAVYAELVPALAAEGDAVAVR